jgi:predicted ATPase/transcriptional regulator with XRE-family HTH domain
MARDELIGASAAPVGFGELLRRHRLAAGLTQQNLAERAGLSEHGIQKLERGVTRPYRDTVQRLLSALRLGPEDAASFRAAGEPVPRHSSLHAEPPDSTRRNNLPIALSRFVGREHELVAVTGRLVSARLLTLTGIGGCGKTRLALEVARGVVPNFAGGVWLVELGPLADPKLVPQQVGATVGVRENSNQPLTTALAAAVADRTMLLVLDNCEHLLQASAVLVDALLRACPNLQILATSREPLGIAGEVAWRVPSLVVPDPEHAVSVAEIEESPSVELFLDRATSAQPRFRLTERNAAAVAQICQRLDGIPLALELAAARVEALTPQQLADRLDQRFRLLTGGSRVALPRQQTLQATLDWSYDLLSKPERRLFERLAVFAGHWTLEAAEAVCAGGGLAAQDVLDLLARLVRKSLVVATEAADGVERYRLLETVREYARQKLLTRGAAETTAVRERHATFYSAQAESLHPATALRAGWDSGDSSAEAVRDGIEQIHDNVRAALGWWLAIRRAREGLSLAVTLCQFWMWRGMYGEARRWLEPMQDLATDHPGAAETAVPEVPLTLRVRALSLLATLASRRGEHAQASAFLELCVALSRELADTATLSGTLALLGLALWLSGSEERAAGVLDESLRLGREVGDPGGVALTLRHLGLIARWQAHYERAVTFLQESLAQARWPMWNRGHAVARGLSNLGRVAYLQSDYPQARAHLCQAVEVIRRSGLTGQAMADCLDWLGAVEAAQGEPVRAARLFGAAEAQWQAIGAIRYTPDLQAYERDVASVRTQLDEPAFAAAWAEGRALTLDQALAHALQGNAD